MTDSPRVRRLALAALVAPGVFSLCWLIAGGVADGYSHDREYVSELAASNAPHRWIVTLGIAALGLGMVALGRALSLALPRGRWSRLPGRLFLIAGVAMTAEAVLPLDCAPSVDHACKARAEGWDLSWHHYAHDLVGLGIQLVLAATPFALALALRPGRLARLAFALGSVGLLLGVAQYAASAGNDAHAGIYQRAGLTILHGWTSLIAVALLLAAETGVLARARPAADP